MKKILATSALALTALAGAPALADSWDQKSGYSWPSTPISSPAATHSGLSFGAGPVTTATTTYDYMRRDGGLREHGMRFTLEGDYDTFFYETNLMRYGVGNTAARGADFRAGYRVFSMFNVQGQYETNRIGNNSGDRFMVGVGTDVSLDSFDFGARVLTDTSELAKDWQVVMTGEYGLSRSLDLVGEFQHDRFDNASNTNTIEGGARWHISNGAFVDGRLRAQRTGGNTDTGASIGLGFSF